MKDSPEHLTAGSQQERNDVIVPRTGDRIESVPDAGAAQVCVVTPADRNRT